MFITFDPETGKYLFLTIRYPGDADQLPDITKKMILRSPEVVNTQGDRPADKIAFTFQNKRRNYREDTIVVNDDGQAQQAEVQKSKRVNIESTRDYDTAAKTALRRQQEVIANQSALLFEMNHGARKLMAGKVFYSSETEDGIPFRVTEVLRAHNSGRLEVSTLIDSYDAMPDTAETAESFVSEENPVSLPAVGSIPANLDDFDALELPRTLSDQKIQFFFPQIRHYEGTVRSLIWLSRDGTSYTLSSDSDIFHGGGYLATELTNKNAFLETGPNFQELGIDNLNVENLDDLEDSWTLGRQIAIIGGREICFLRSILNIGSGIWTMKGLIRGRFGTEIETWPVGTKVYIVLAHRLQFLSTNIMVPGASLKTKLQPLDGRGSVSLANITANSKTIQGYGYRPSPITALREEKFRRKYAAAETLTFRWCYQSSVYPKTGLGQQGFGVKTGLSPARGYFLVEILNNLGVVKRTEQKTTAEFTYSQAQRTTDSMSTTWTIRITQVEGSFSSNSLTLEMNE